MQVEAVATNVVLLPKLGRKGKACWGNQGSGEELGNLIAPLKGTQTIIRHRELEDEEEKSWRNRQRLPLSTTDRTW